MSSEIERALARKEQMQAGPHSPAPPGGRVLEHDPLASFLEMGRVLSATIELREGVQGVLEVLSRWPAIFRSAITLDLPDLTELVVDGGRDRASAGLVGDQHRFLCTTVVLDGRPIGALAVDLIPERDDARVRTEQLVEAAAELIGQAVQLRQMLAREAETDPIFVAPGASLAEMVSRYEKQLIEQALQTTRGNRSRAARLLRTTERIVGYRVQQYGIDCSVFRG